MNGMHGRSLSNGLFLTIGTVLLVSAGSAHAAEMWCRRDFDRDNRVCVFLSAGDCIRAAGPFGGVCEREQLGRAEPAKPCKTAAAGNRRAAKSAACDAS